MDSTPNVSLKGINAALAIIPKPLRALSTQYHCMETIKQAIGYLSPGKTQVDVCDQLVFALTEEIQWKYLEKFGSGSYFCLFGGLHFEQCMLSIYGELIKSNGLKNILSNIEMWIIGTGALAHANYIKQML